MLSTFLLSLTLLAGPTTDSTIIERLGVKGPITFDGVSYELAWTNTRDGNFYIQEYIPRGQKLETYTQMITVKLLKKETALSVVTLERMNLLEERKKSDALCQYALIESPDSKEYILDFITSESEGKILKSASFSIYRYRQIEIAGKPALLQLAYTQRAMSDGIEGMLRSVAAKRDYLISAMAETTMPTPVF
jgi:hypothetical protein